MYDYHGECDLVLLHNPQFKNNLGMDIHIRTKIRDFWSSVETAALKIGDEILEIQARPDSKDWLWLNGQVNEVLESGKWYHSLLSGFLVRFKQSMGEVGLIREVRVSLEGTAREVLALKAVNSFVRVSINWKGSKNYENSTGLLGSHAHGGERLGRDGITFIEDINAFGQEWQVQPMVDGQLFHSYVGAVVDQKCVLPPAYTPEMQQLRRRRLAESEVTEEAAKKACVHLIDPKEISSCVYDVLATQDLKMALDW